MKSTALVPRLLLFVLFILSAQLANAQIAYTLHGTAAVANYPYAPLKPGFGAGAKLFITSYFAVGIAAKYTALGYKHKQSSSSIITNTGSLIPITTTADLYLAKGPVRPYMGLEAGAYFHSLKTDVEGNGSYRATYTKLGTAPKLGISFKVNKLSLFAEGSYQFLFGSTNGSVTDQTVKFRWQTPNQYWFFNAGVSFGMP
ncbi:hypothetical protein [Siphonobacter sp. SORGH_AS_0500]|uniref:hypothetical protein n=1 Tax=Siphonobacter sp. SORGH_AS_0500 TaxID=1864824 RepID=UPI0012FECE19|nr:hypothetical protein [Siphonobacter sp. SORGH_AS_0500]